MNSEKRKTVVCAVNTEEGFEGLYGRFSSYNRLLRVVGWMNRFSSNSKCIRTDRISGNLSNEEIKKAEMTLMKLVQRETFSGSEDKRLKNLPVMIDSHGLLRFKTRILRREDTESFRFPIILPSQHSVVRLLIIQGHEELLNTRECPSL